MANRLLLGGCLLMVALIGFGCGRSADDLFNAGEKASHNASTYPKAEKDLREFIRRFPDDPRADVALIALARILQNQDRPADAISAYREVLDRHPDSPKADEAQFMIGYIHDSRKEYDKARPAYQAVIDRYPRSDFADDARASLLHLGKSPEQWLSEIQPDTLTPRK